VADGHTLGTPSNTADVVFSYITLQHCHRDDAIGLTREAVRVARPGGRVLLNYRTWVPQDAVLFPAGAAVRALFRLPTVGPKVAQMRLPTRLGWQANRLAPAEVLAAVGDSLDDICIFRSPKRRPFALPNTIDATFDGIDASHWWLTATVR
jgi:SAM-dependent methyltransferase